MTLNIKQLGQLAVGWFFLLMLIFPTVLQAQRGVLLGLILGGTFIYALEKSYSWRVARPIFMWTMVCVTYSLFSISWGMINNAPGALNSITAYAIWPILYIYLAGFTNSAASYILFAKVIFIGTFVAAISGVLLLVSSFISLPIFITAYLNLIGGSFGFYDGVAAYSLFTTTTSIYGFAFCAANLFHQPGSFGIYGKVWKTVNLFLFLLTFVALLTSGRRAFVLIGLISIPISLFYAKVIYRSSFSVLRFIKPLGGIFFISFCAAFYAALIFELKFDAIYMDFLDGFDFLNTKNEAAFRRTEQFYGLIAAWVSSPLIGLGLGSSAMGETGWQYELSYVALLAQTGLIGVLLYSAAVLWLVYKSIKIAQIYHELSILIFPALVALTCFLVANATNPYLATFDYLWVLFLPAGLVNLGLIKNRSRLMLTRSHSL